MDCLCAIERNSNPAIHNPLHLPNIKNGFRYGNANIQIKAINFHLLPTSKIVKKFQLKIKKVRHPGLEGIPRGIPHNVYIKESM
jgi:hypothetical protein